jgi:hypothetical protein
MPSLAALATMSACKSSVYPVSNVSKEVVSGHLTGQDERFRREDWRPNMEKKMQISDWEDVTEESKRRFDLEVMGGDFGRGSPPHQNSPTLSEGKVSRTRPSAAVQAMILEPGAPIARS